MPSSRISYSRSISAVRSWCSRELIEQICAGYLTMIDFDDEPDQEKRIEKLRGKLQELGDEISHESDLPADMEEEFLKHILAFETADQQSLMQWLENAGLEILPPEQLTDELLPPKLWEVIKRMASLGAYL